MAEPSKTDIRLRRTGGAGPNAQWQWELVGADGQVIKTGTAIGEEHKAFATARKFAEKLTKA